MEAAILNLLSKLSSPILEEFGLLWGIEKQHQKLKSKLLTIEAVLQDAEERQVKDRAVKVWLRKLKDVAYDADDLVDEFMVEALRRKVEIRDGMQKKVRNFFSNSNPLVFRVKMAHKMQEVRERLDEIAKEKNDFHFKERVPADNQPRISSTRETHSFVIESEVYGRDNEKATIIDSLINDGEDEVLSVISIVGMGGLGKTTLAQLVYNDKRVAAHFALKMWVYVSLDFDVGRLVKEISQSATNTRCDPLSMDLLQTHLQAELSEKRYLLVLDDVWNEVHEKWDKLKTLLKCGAQGSKLIVTTRSKIVASIMGTQLEHDLKTLSEKDSWSLFEKLAHPDPKFISIGKEMVQNCGGVPLAVKTLGGLMSTKTSESEWLSVRNSESWKSQDIDGGVLPALQLSYNYLTPHLKQCFAYCAVFPRGAWLKKENIIRQWVALGFIQSGDENKLSEEEKGEDFFNDLLSRFLFQVAEKDAYMDNVIFYRMHDLIHDFLRFAAGTESITMEDYMKIDPEETRHFALHTYREFQEREAYSKTLEALENGKKLRSMLLYDFIDINVCSRFRCLKVLDLSFINIGYLPDSLGKLKHLRYLNVSFATCIKLPETICNLLSLQTLILNGPTLEKLPKDIKRMISLRHIEYYNDVKFPMPNGIGELTCLQTLRKFTISKEGAGIEELERLNQLRGELCIEGLENVRNEKCANEAKLMEKQRLCSLSLSWSYVETIIDARVNLENVLENLEPHPNLKELSILKYMGLNFPSWIKKLTNLVKISLSNCNNCEHPPSLGQLRFLEALEMSHMESVKYIFDEAYNDEDIFPSLKELELSNMPSLEGWWPHQVDNGEQQERRHEQVFVGCLRRLEIFDCPKLTQLPRVLFSSALESLALRNVGCERIALPSSQSLKALKKLSLCDMEHLEEILLQAHGIEDLYAENCPKLTQLPRLLFSPALETLELWNVGCERIEMPSSQSLKALKKVHLFDMQHLEELSLQQAHGLEELQLKNCLRMIHLPHHLPSLKRLKIYLCNYEMLFLKFVANYPLLDNLSIGGFPQETNLQEKIGRYDASLPGLEIDDRPKSVSLSNILKNLSTLKSLSISDFPDLMLLSDELKCLGSLKSLSISNSCLKQTSISGFPPSLEILELMNCKNLECLYFDGLPSLTSIESYGCPKLWSFSSDWVSNLTSLVEVDIKGAESLPESFGNLISLRSLWIRSSPALTSLPESTGNLKSLDRLYIHGCDALTSLPESIGNLTSLTHLMIANCHVMRSLPESVGNLISLKGLIIDSCLEMRALPESIGNLARLNMLGISGFPILKALPESTRNLKSLYSLSINDCVEMETLPKGMQSLTNLQELTINNCPILKRRLLNKKKIMKGRMGEDLHKVECVFLDGQDPR